MASSHGSGSGLGPDERDRLAALRSAASLSDLVELTGADSEREAYVAARREWAALRGRELAASGEFAPAQSDVAAQDTEAVLGDGVDSRDDLPGNCVVVDGHEFRVHGVTHADTRAEREFLREHVSGFLDRGAAVYCEQGIRSMYFADVPDVCEMDDLSWAIRQCEKLEAGSGVAGSAGSTVPDVAGSIVADFAESTVADFAESAVTELSAEVESLARRVRDAMFSLAASRGDHSEKGFAVALGGLASALLTSHEDAAVGDDFESFAKSRRAARNPEALAELQQFYEKTFLPQPVEREWLRRHDPELELLTHARNERMADYAVYQTDDAEEVHLIVGAAHQPGVTYYLEQLRDGRRSVEDFEYVE